MLSHGDFRLTYKITYHRKYSTMKCTLSNQFIVDAGPEPERLFVDSWNQYGTILSILRFSVIADCVDNVNKGEGWPHCV